MIPLFVLALAVSTPHIQIDTSGHVFFPNRMTPEHAVLEMSDEIHPQCTTKPILTMYDPKDQTKSTEVYEGYYTSNESLASRDKMFYMLLSSQWKKTCFK